MELWNDIPGYEGAYQVSSEGNVRSLDRVISFLNNGTMCNRAEVGRVLKSNMRSRYKSVEINKQSYSIHRLVALAFIPNPDNKATVDHIDRDPLNNTLSNLRWATHKEQNKNRTFDYGNTGNQYVYMTRENTYSVQIPKRLCKRYKTLQEAITARDQYLDSLE